MASGTVPEFPWAKKTSKSTTLTKETDGNPNGTTVMNQEPKTPFSRRHLAEALTLQVGECMDFAVPILSLRKHIAEHNPKKEAAFDLRPIDATRTRVTRLPFAPRLSIRQRLEKMEVGDTVVVDGPMVQSVRVMAGSLSDGVTAQYSVSEIGVKKCRVTRVDPTALRDKPAKYPFKTLAPGGLFTAARGKHSGLPAMRSMCSKLGGAEGLLYEARENIDGSITVRCYVLEARPPKWHVDGEHAKMQAAIAAAQAQAANT